MVNVYFRYPAAIVKGSGAILWDAEGRRYIDLMGGYGVAIVGHSHPKVVEALREQIGRLTICHPSLYNDVRASLLEKLVTIAPKGLNKVYLGSSGAEAVEVAIKMAKKNTGRSKLVSTMGGFHGKTLGALSVTWNPKYREPFKDFLIRNVEFVPYGNLEKAEATIDENTMAFIVEPIQGENGVKIPPDDYLKGLRDICDRRGSLLIIDEIQTGLGRTGAMWACQHWNVKPDIICIGKGLAGGVPMGAVLAREDVGDSLKLGEHTSTFGGNPLACAAASAVIDVIVGEKLPERAKRLGEVFKRELEKLKQAHSSVREVRGLGLMRAAELRFDIKDVIVKSLENGLITLYSGRNILRFLPPLVIEEGHILEASKILDNVLSTFS
ncbi:aspartate aminotransferase family protein [Candidatus Bathyarchaeota archaeon]|nr:aspartate aminotransferase family protein [Candidatus Bathyarchaeota archaeon]MBS7613854.1 aspartate aminotransferase family protein [Candidatus Bathyarchaeota archaeon]MBS7618551.1 aspartate aminotransferase family protein [Candidatus Bathyarchaeota archaeon]